MSSKLLNDLISRVSEYDPRDDLSRISLYTPEWNKLQKDLLVILEKLKLKVEEEARPPHKSSIRDKFRSILEEDHRHE